jgi:hypothetical protein
LAIAADGTIGPVPWERVVEREDGVLEVRLVDQHGDGAEGFADLDGFVGRILECHGACPPFVPDVVMLASARPSIPYGRIRTTNATALGRIDRTPRPSGGQSESPASRCRDDRPSTVDKIDFPLQIVSAGSRRRQQAPRRAASASAGTG